MAKGQKRSSKEAKKPKANKPKTSVSDYKKSVIASGHKLRAISAQRPCRGTQRPVRRERARRSVRLRGDLVSYVERDGRGNVRDPREAGLMMHRCGWPTRASAQALKRAIASLYVIVLLDTRQAPRSPLAAFSPSPLLAPRRTPEGQPRAAARA
jgi:hypothetical protein